jgi:hypothetical protein
MYGKKQQVQSLRLCGVTVKARLSVPKIMSKYYYSRDYQAFQECLVELLAVIATSYEEVDAELSFLRQAVLGEDKEQTKFR